MCMCVWQCVRAFGVVFVCVCVCVCTCIRECGRSCVRVCVSVCVSVCRPTSPSEPNAAATRSPAASTRVSLYLQARPSSTPEYPRTLASTPEYPRTLTSTSECPCVRQLTRSALRRRAAPGHSRARASPRQSTSKYPGARQLMLAGGAPSALGRRAGPSGGAGPYVRTRIAASRSVMVRAEPRGGFASAPPAGSSTWQCAAGCRPRARAQARRQRLLPFRRAGAQARARAPARTRGAGGRGRRTGAARTQRSSASPRASGVTDGVVQWASAPAVVLRQNSTSGFASPTNSAKSAGANAPGQARRKWERAKWERSQALRPKGE
jgi:hypothetical protein